MSEAYSRDLIRNICLPASAVEYVPHAAVNRYPSSGPPLSSDVYAISTTGMRKNRSSHSAPGVAGPYAARRRRADRPPRLDARADRGGAGAVLATVASRQNSDTGWKIESHSAFSSSVFSCLMKLACDINVSSGNRYSFAALAASLFA